MLEIKKLISKTWIFGVAALAIAGSSCAMAFALNNNNVPESSTVEVAPYTTPVAANIQTPAIKSEATAEYTVVDQSNRRFDNRYKSAMMNKLSNSKEFTREQAPKKYDELITNITPDENDISADQAAAYAAEKLQKVFDVDFTGYTADATFLRNHVPNSHSWFIAFHKLKEEPNTRTYIASVNALNGTIHNIYSHTTDFSVENNKDLENPEWKNKAIQVVQKFIPENTTIIDSTVLSATSNTGVTVLCKLSDNSAYFVRLSGDNKEIEAFIYYPNGYDGSLDFDPDSCNGVG